MSLEPLSYRVVGLGIADTGQECPNRLVMLHFEVDQAVVVDEGGNLSSRCVVTTEGHHHLKLFLSEL